MKRYIALFIIILTCIISPLSAQSDKNDSTKNGKDKKDKGVWDFYLEEYRIYYKGSPSLELTYGETKPELKNYDESFPKAGIIELKLGWHKESNTKSPGIVKYRNSIFYGSYISGSIKPENSVSGSPATLRFGFGTSKGYGYKLFKKSSLILYNSGFFTWTRYDNGIKTEEYGLSNFDRNDDFNRSLRFGSTAEGGLIIPAGSLINIQVSYDRTIVFPWHLVWKHIGSVMIEALGQSLIDGFISGVFKATPAAAPIVNFILKNGLSYGLYELRKEKMNWPFNSAEPLMFNTFKLGMTFTF